MTRQEILAIAKPILFNTEMVRAILDGHKTVTRRAIKQNIEAILHGQARADHPELSDSHFIRKLCSAPCQPGDYLYVRETWRVQAAHRFEADARIEFKAGGPMQTIQFANGSSQGANRMDYDAFLAKWFDHARWHPSIHMPKEAARIFLQVTDIKPCELWKCGVYSIFDIVSEGVDINETCRECIENYGEPCCNKEDYEDDSICGMLDEARAEFGKVWDRTIKKEDLPRYGWDANPWAWVIEFERVIPEEAN